MVHTVRFGIPKCLPAIERASVVGDLVLAAARVKKVVELAEAGDREIL